MRKPRGRSNAIDAYVGSRVRAQRTLLGLNQTKLGEAMGVSYQQVQKYENGKTRIAAGRLYAIAKILDVPVSYFYEDMPDEAAEVAQPVGPLRPDESEPDPMHKRETLELVRAYYRIEDATLRLRLRETVRALAGERRRGRRPNV